MIWLHFMLTVGVGLMSDAKVPCIGVDEYILAVIWTSVIHC